VRRCRSNAEAAVKHSYGVNRGGDECDVDDGRVRRMGRGAAVKMDPTISYVLRSRLSGVYGYHESMEKLSIDRKQAEWSAMICNDMSPGMMKAWVLNLASVSRLIESFLHDLIILDFTANDIWKTKI
jgi:hypothetical protein